jgi:hypothetical protein
MDRWEKTSLLDMGGRVEDRGFVTLWVSHRDHPPAPALVGGSRSRLGRLRSSQWGIHQLARPISCMTAVAQIVEAHRLEPAATARWSARLSTSRRLLIAAAGSVI